MPCACLHISRTCRLDVSWVLDTCHLAGDCLQLTLMRAVALLSLIDI
jgi:hypothetical protein